VNGGFLQSQFEGGFMPGVPDNDNPFGIDDDGLSEAEFTE